MPRPTAIPKPTEPQRDPALPAWITAERIAQTRAVWQPFYPDHTLTDDDAVEMLLNVAQLYRVLAEDPEDDDEYALEHEAADEQGRAA